MRGAVVHGLVVAAIVLASRRAEAYPQYQLSRDQTCRACHLSPAGGGLLGENGLAVAEAKSQWGTPPGFLYDLVPLPSWLALGGDLRSASGLIATPDRRFAIIPMQADLHARAHHRGFSLQLTVGARPAQWLPGNQSPPILDRLWSREHYVMWQQDPEAGDGLSLRAGRFMPVFGLRLVEHPLYVRRHGGTPLYAETYAAAVEYVSAGWEAHVTGFVADPYIDPVVADDGVAVYAERRFARRVALGGELMIASHPGATTIRGGATAKLYLPDADLLVQAELQLVRRRLDGPGDPDQLVGHVMASRALGDALLVDVGWGHHDENLAIAGLERDALDVNLHWFVTSHIELVWQNRIEGIGVAASRGGPTSGWSLVHVHYRL